MPGRDPRHDPRPGDRFRLDIEVCAVENRIVHYLVVGSGECGDLINELSVRLENWRYMARRGFEVLPPEER